MNQAVIIGAIGTLIVAVIGGFIQLQSGRVLAERKFKQDSRRDIYTQFVDVFWELHGAQPDDDAKQTKKLQYRYAKISTQLSLYCTADSLKYLSIVLRQTSIDSKTFRNNWVNLICALRSDLGEKDKNETRESVHGLLFDRPQVGGQATSEQSAAVASAPDHG